MSGREALKQQIRGTFAGVPYPSDPIIEHDCDECRELEKAFAGKDWKAIELSVIRDNYDKLPLFSSAAFHYFLRAYLLHAVDHLAEDDVCEFTAYAVAPGNKSIRDHPKYQEERFGLLSPEQTEVVHEFLNTIKEDPQYVNLAAEIEKGQTNLERLSARVGSRAI